LHLSPAPFEPFRFEGRTFHLKRDDLIHPLLSGNKYRKLFSLIKTPPHAVDTVCSFGGIQSNAMLSIAALCRMKGWRFAYTAKTVPASLRAAPAGNYRNALALGMQLHEVHPTVYEEAIGALKTSCEAPEGERTVLIPQGGADPLAEAGVGALAEEIETWRQRTGIGRLTIATPSGTGTTAAYLARALPACRVVTVAAVGDPDYLKAQIGRLMPLPDNLRILPTRYRFAAPHGDLLQMYHRLYAAGVTFDLLYAPVMWIALLENLSVIEGELLYVHSGGVGGNETMLARYERMKTDEGVRRRRA